MARFGRLDVAINNAGTEGTPGPITEQSPRSYAATFDTNVLGVLLSLNHELRVMSAQKAATSSISRPLSDGSAEPVRLSMSRANTPSKG